MSIKNELHSKPNVLFLCSWFPNLTSPTLGNFVEKHRDAAQLFSETATIAFFSRKQVGLINNDIDLNSKLIVSYVKKYNGIFKILQILLFMKAFVNSYKTVCSKWFYPEIVHLNVVYPAGIFALYLKWMKNIPFVVTEHSTTFVNPNNSDGLIKKLLTKIILNNASYILPVTGELGKKLKNIAPRVKQKIISNVVNECVFNIVEKSLNPPSKKKKFIHISTLSVNKNIPGLLNVILQLSISNSDFELIIISDGDQSFAKEFCVKNNLYNTFVFFYETQTTEQIAKFIQISDALLLFSDLENFPCVIPEAWMSGIPVITTAVNGIPEFVTNKNGLLVAAKNERDLLVTLIKFINNNYIFDKELIRDYALKKFSFQHIGTEFVTIYNEVLTLNKTLI
jgi:glycosyltransferase involved in cell wall biosynthesis